MDLNQEIQNALEVLQNGGIMLYPTETVWGIGCDGTNQEAVEKILKLKKNSQNQPMICLVNNDKMIHNIFKDVPEVAWQIMDLSEKPTTLVLDKPVNIAKNLISHDNALAIRVTKDSFCNKLLDIFRKPLVATTANISGKNCPQTFAEISKEIITGVDYVVNLSREKKGNPLSTIIKITLDNQVKIIRN